ncbi:hypothetical protein ACX3O0_13150 [Homoserinimonas sp. A447]
MGTLGWIAVGLYLALGAGALIANARPHAQERVVSKFALQVGLPLPEQLAEPIRRRMLNRRRSSTIGAMIGAITSAIAFLLSPASTPADGLNPLVVVAGTLAGWAIGTSVSAFRSSAGDVSSDRPRYARAHAVELGDYVSPAELWLARVPVGLAVVATVTITTLAQVGWVRYDGTAALVGSIVLALVTVGTLIACELVGRRVVAMGNHVTSPEDLVWEDAVRAITIRELVSAPTFLGYYVLLMALNPLLVSPDDSARVGFAIASLCLAIVTLVIAVGMLVSALAVKRRFLRRLWPELATGAGL